MTVADLPGQRPSGSADAEAVALALVSSEVFVDGLLTAMPRRQEQRDNRAREEAERLAASVIAPARAGLPTG
ncbi:hypothetical protein [Streptomyces sp. NPDC026589]|uniref:hypothetical protein n=1 Tax=Streptomyces sp. NPDC026589 TaxID=3155609 RepID=UPI0033D96C3E